MTWNEAVKEGFIQAIMDGKKLQELSKDNYGNEKWVVIPEQEVLRALGECFMREIRIKPTPKRVPLTAEDLPPVFWVAVITAKTKWYLCEQVFDIGIGFNGITMLFSQLPESYIWSPDRKTEHPFWKEVEE